MRSTLRLAVLVVLSACGGPLYSGGLSTPAPGSNPESLEGERGFTVTSDEPLSTFAVDVDTGSYTYARKMLTELRQRPPAATVRPEEFLNFFEYQLTEPTGSEPFAVTVDGAPSPFGEGLHLLRVALKGREVEQHERKPANLVFLVDVSGSMAAADKLPLAQRSLHKLADQLAETDRLSLVVYAGSDRVVLEPVAATAANRARLHAAIDDLKAGGSTAGEAGIRGAYKLAEQAYIEGGINRVILCTDGDFNVGVTGDELYKLIEQKRDSGVTLTTLGFGTGNYNDQQMEQLADRGNGFYAYVDGDAEADRVFGVELLGTLQVIAKDVKVQLRFDPAAVVRYRLIGYDNRRLDAQDFTNDRKDAGDIGAGHRVVALYEVELAAAASAPARLAEVALRFKEPDGVTSAERLVEFPASALSPSIDEASSELRFAAAVVELAEQLRGSKHATASSLRGVRDLAAGATNGVAAREELVKLVDIAATVK